jgi:cytochrome c-type biogenesis protein CcmH/NrfG
MAQSMQSLYAYGRAFDVALIAASVAAAVAAILSLCSYLARGRCEGWRERRAQRRYVRAGMRDLESYLTRASTTAARRPPGPPGSGRWPGSGR